VRCRWVLQCFDLDIYKRRHTHIYTRSFILPFLCRTRTRTSSPSSSSLLARVQDVSARDLARLHLVVDHLQLRQADDLERRLDEAAREKVNRLGAVLAVANIRALDADHLDDRLEDGRLEVRAGGQADADDGAARADVLCGLLERLLVDGDEDDGVRAEAVGRRGLHVCDDVLALYEVDKGFAAELLHHLLLVVACVNANHTAAHCLGVLARERSETTTGADNGDKLARFHARLLQALVDGDTSAEDGGNGGEVALLGDAGNVSRFGNAVLLEGAVDRVPGEQGLCAERLIRCLAEATSKTGSVDPLDTGVFANFDIINQIAAGDNDTSAFVTTDKRQLGGLLDC
jgi:hypothetical protein